MLNSVTIHINATLYNKNIKEYQYKMAIVITFITSPQNRYFRKINVIKINEIRPSLSV